MTPSRRTAASPKVKDTADWSKEVGRWRIVFCRSFLAAYWHHSIASFQDLAEYRASGLSPPILDWLQSAVEARARFCVDAAAAAAAAPVVFSRSHRRPSRHGRHCSKMFESKKAIQPSVIIHFLPGGAALGA